MARNADLYVASLLDPEIHGVRIPDGSSFPSVTTTDRTLIPLTFVTVGAGPARIAGITYAPSFAYNTARISAATTTANLTWSGSGFPDEVTYSNNFFYGRFVSAGARVHDFGALLNRGVEVVALAGNMTYAVNTAYKDALDNPNSSYYDSSSVDQKELTVTWSPLTLQSCAVSVTSAQLTLGSEYVAIANGLVSGDTCFQLFFYDALGTASDNIQIELIQNMECIPFDTTQVLFDTQSVPGSMSDVSASMDTVLASGVNKVKEFGFSRVAAKALKLAKGMQQVARASSGVMSVLGLGKEELKTVMAAHHLCVGLGQSQHSPLNLHPTLLGRPKGAGKEVLDCALDILNLAKKHLSGGSKAMFGPCSLPGSGPQLRGPPCVEEPDSDDCSVISMRSGKRT
jgi:hypothetical protein